jgi:hypothetical protein
METTTQTQSPTPGQYVLESQAGSPGPQAEPRDVLSTTQVGGQVEPAGCFNTVDLLMGIIKTKKDIKILKAKQHVCKMKMDWLQGTINLLDIQIKHRNRELEQIKTIYSNKEDIEDE